MSTQAVTVAIRREVDPDHIIDATLWVQTGVNLAHRYPGFLGSGWIRAGEESHVWHMLYRFANANLLDEWENSTERRDWLSTGQGFVRSERTKRRTGIEGWFDEPATGAIPTTVAEAEAQDPARTSPRRWKQAVAIWLGFFPVNLAFSYAVSPLPFWGDLDIWLRVLITTLVLTPIMTFWVLPWVTRMIRPWLAR